MSSNVFSAGDKSDSLPLDTLDEVLIDEYKPCSDQNDFDTVEINDVSSFMILSGDASFTEGDEIISSNNARAIVSSFDKDINKLSYYQNAKTGFKSFVINAKVAGPYKGISFIKEFVFDFVVPCSDFIVSLEESPQQMFFVFTESNEVIKSKLASQEMMAEIKVEMARQALLDAFLQKLADEKAAAAASTAAYQAKLAYELRVTKIMDDLIVQLGELGITEDYKSTIADELINEATEKLEDEKFIGTISGEIVTVAIHDFCKVNLGLSDSNIVLFKKALKGGYLGNVGPQVSNGTEFTSKRWDDYIECVGSKRI